MNKADIRAYLDFIYAYELSHGKDPLLRVRATKEDLDYMIRTMPRKRTATYIVMDEFGD